MTAVIVISMDALRRRPKKSHSQCPNIEVTHEESWKKNNKKTKG